MTELQDVLKAQQVEYAKKLIRSLTYLAATRTETTKDMSLEEGLLIALEDAGLELKEA